MTTRRQVLAGSSAALLAGAVPRLAWGATQTDVLVIGAGLAGLNAARLLVAACLKVTVIEGEERIGGRLHTLDHLAGRPEAGGIQIGSGYTRLRAIAAELQVPLIQDRAEARGALYRIGKQTVRGEDWTTSPANRLVGTERGLAPAALGQFYAAKLPPLAGLEDWTTPAAIAAFDQLWGDELARLGASNEAQRLIAANLNGNSLNTLSALHIARSAAIFRAGPGPTFTVSGGSQRLPEAMVADLQAKGAAVRTGRRVIALHERTDGVTLRLADGTKLAARQAICTIPFAALGNVIVDTPNPRFNPVQRQLAYTAGTFLYLQASEPFWRHDGLPETLWSDDPLLARVFVLGDDPAMLKVFATGQSALALDRLSPQQAGTAAITRIEAARPSAKGKLTLAGVHSWQAQAGARGIYHHLTPGTAAPLAALARSTTGRLHFAGEHLALQASGMEGALESGERAALAVLARS